MTLDRRQVITGIAGTVAASALPATAQAQQSRIIIQRISDFRGYDPHKVYVRAAGEALPLLLDTLVTIEDDMSTIQDGLAREWTISQDGLTYRFVLKDNLKFFDGKALTAKSVEASFRRWQDPATKSSGLIILGPLDTVTAVDAQIVEFKLREPYPEFITRLASPYAGIIDAEEAIAAGDQFGVTQMNASGPYGWGSWRPGDEQVLIKNPNHTWGNRVYKTIGPVKPDVVVFKLMPEENSRAASMLAAQSDISYIVPWVSIGTLRKDPRFEISEPRAFGWLYYLNAKLHRPLMEPAVRRAMNLAVDRAAMVDAFYYGEADPAFSALSPKFKGYAKSIEAKLPKFDPAAARKILDEAGWKIAAGGIRSKNGVRLSPLCVGYDRNRPILEAYQSMLADIGIELRLDLAPSAVQVGRIQTKDDFDMHGYYASYTSIGELFELYFRPSQGISPFSGAKEQGQRLSDLVARAGKELDPDKRQALYAEAQALVADENLWVPMIHERMVVVSNKNRVTGVKPHGIGGNGLYKAMDLATV